MQLWHWDFVNATITLGQWMTICEPLMLLFKLKVRRTKWVEVNSYTTKAIRLLFCGSSLNITKIRHHVALQNCHVRHHVDHASVFIEVLVMWYTISHDLQYIQCNIHPCHLPCGMADVNLRAHLSKNLPPKDFIFPMELPTPRTFTSPETSTSYQTSPIIPLEVNLQ